MFNSFLSLLLKTGCPKSTCRLERVLRLQTCENRITGNPLISFLILIPDLCSVTIRECTFGMDSFQSPDEGFPPGKALNLRRRKYVIGVSGTSRMPDAVEWYKNVFDGYVL
ncbi:hypothetical protein CEXT_719051 [Caerostris extrusa]|uniref:Uncharacterized protein n=1 Tax=Caerostris extrusa TaxID=172846 RepID=A0AAV4U475_CAEEX|nr:hypothetical protein CEXT_719051 [Caerostris extrusa]